MKNQIHIVFSVMGKSIGSGVFVVIALFIQLCFYGTLSCLEPERQALLKLKQSFKDPGNRLITWNTSTDCCDWKGVDCDPETGHVFDLQLYDFSDSSPKLLATEVSPSLAELKYLDTLSMDRCDFQGSRIPEFIGSFEYLRNLDLHQSGFGGMIPESLGNLSRLTFLDLSENELTGVVPESLGRSSTMFNYLLLSQNKLQGPIPKSLGSLSTLTRLDLSGNLLNGTIPQSLGSLSGLTQLHLSNNELTGSIPASVWSLENLEILDVSSNELEGTISELNFLNISKLTTFHIGSNKLTCKFKPDWTPNVNLTAIDMSFCAMRSQFPRWLQTQTGLRFLDLSNANISGNFPTFLHQMADLYHLDLSANQITGNLPKNIADHMPGLQTLRLRNNLFTGPVPESFCELSRVQVLDLSRNNLSGELPDCWGGLHDLVIVLLSSNKISGKIPNSILHYYSLKQLLLSDNNFDGEIPLALKNCTSLEILDLGENRFFGTIPSWIGGSLSSLRILRLRSNTFGGTIPLQLCQRTELQILDLALNDLSGEIPRCFNNITRMTDNYNGPPPEEEVFLAPDDYDTDEWDKEEISQVMKGTELEYTTTLRLLDSIDLSSNSLIGSIPEELCDLSRLRSLNLSRNRLSGNIPDKIGGLETIESLDLSYNMLDGEIPQGMSALKYLNSLDLSNNDLSGKIPTSNQLQTLVDPSIYKGNLGLCGDPLPKKCPGDEPQMNSGDKDTENDEDKSGKIWFYFSIVFGYVTGLWAVVFTLAWKRSLRVAYFGFVDSMKERVFGQ